MTKTIIQQGRFTSDGAATTLDLRSDIDWIEVINETQWATTQTPGRGVKFEWQRGLADNNAFEYTKADGTNVLQAENITAGGFLLIDESDQSPEAINTTGTAITAATPAVISATSTTGILQGDVIRMIDCVAMEQISGLEFEVGTVVTDTTMGLAFLAAAGFAAAGTTCSFRRVPFDSNFSPRKRTITGITAAASAVITMSITHGYSVGEVVRFQVPAVFGMTQIDNLTGEISAVNTTTNTITVDINSSAFTAFAFPASASVPFSFAEVIPIGTQSSTSVSDATNNLSVIGIQLGAGIDGPAGSNNDVIYWRAGKSFSISNS